MSGLACRAEKMYMPYPAVVPNRWSRSWIDLTRMPWWSMGGEERKTATNGVAHQLYLHARHAGAPCSFPHTSRETNFITYFSSYAMPHERAAPVREALRYVDPSC